jgi:hypothetical protein
MATLAKLWPACPDLVEQYLDVMIAALHDFPECLEPTPIRRPSVSRSRGGNRPAMIASVS